MTIGIKQMWEDYVSIPENKIDYRLYSNLVWGFNDRIAKEILEGNTVIFENNLGSMVMLGAKVKVELREDGTTRNLAPDWKATKELWESNPEAREKKQLMYHLNLHTDGLRYRLTWIKKGCKFYNKNFYSFRLIKELKTKLSGLIRGGKKYELRRTEFRNIKGK